MNNERIHFGYVVSFLLLIIICLVTVKWGAIEELTNYITFALTITSLVLALLAIVYSFFSNSSMTRNISNLDSASKKISSNSELLNSAADKLEKTIGDIPVTLKNIESKTEITHKAFEEFTKKEISIPKISAKDKKRIDDKSLGEMVVKNGSISSWGMLLALKLAHEKNKSFNLEHFAETVDLSSEPYLRGFLVGISALGLYQYDTFESPEDVWNWKITALNQKIIDTIEDKIAEIVEKHEKEPHMKFVSEGYERVRAYFN